MNSRRQFLACTSSAAAAIAWPLPAAAQLGSRWEAVPGQVSDVAIGSNGQVWAVGDKPSGAGYQVFRRDGAKWTQVTGGLVNIGVDPMANAWGTDQTNTLWNHDGRKWQKLPGKAIDIACGPEGSVFCLGINAVNGNNELFTWTGSNWKRFSGHGVRLAVDNKGLPWLVNASNEIWRFDGSKWAQVLGAARDIGIGANGAVWVVGTNQIGETGYGIHRWDGRRWQSTDGAANTIAVAPNGMPWVVNANNQVFQRV